MKHWRQLDTPLVTLAIVAIAYAFFLHLQLSKHNYDFSVFITAGDTYVEAEAAPPGLHIIRDSAGYDGQFYYRLGLAPFTATQTDFGITLDIPAYRQQRILYPLLGWLFSLGQPSFLPASLIQVNVFGLSLLAWLGARYAQTVGLHALWGAVFALFPGFLLTLSRNTAEILTAALLLAGILALRQNRQFMSGVLLLLAVLTKETALILPVGLLAAIPFVPKRDYFQRIWFSVALPVAGYLLWQLWLTATWGSASITDHTVGTNVGTPFRGLLHFIGDILPATVYLQRVWLLEILLIALFIIAAMYVLPRSAAPPFIKIAFVLSAGLTVSLTQVVWVEDWAFLRVLAETYLFGVIILMEAHSVLKHWIVGKIVLSWTLLGADILIMR